MKNLLLVSATKMEIAPILSLLNISNSKEATFLNSSWKGINIDILITGVGIMQTSFHLGQQLVKKAYDFVLQAGIAGSFKEHLELGMVLNVSSQLCADLGSEFPDHFKLIYELDFVNENEFPYSNGFLLQPDTNHPFWSKYPKVKGISVNRVSGTTATLKERVSICDPDIESMEGASLFYACLINKVPFAEIRSVSNPVAIRDSSKWDIPLAIKNLNEHISLFFDYISRK